VLCNPFPVLMAVRVLAVVGGLAVLAPAAHAGLPPNSYTVGITITNSVGTNVTWASQGSTISHGKYVNSQGNEQSPPNIPAGATVTIYVEATSSNPFDGPSGQLYYVDTSFPQPLPMFSVNFNDPPLSASSASCKSNVVICTNFSYNKHGQPLNVKATVTTASVARILSARASVQAGGTALVSIACRRATTCRGAASLTHAGRSLGSGRFAIAPHRARRVPVTLTGQALRELLAGRVSAIATARVSFRGRMRITHRRSVVLG
jgi:hypothetical protein